MEREEKLNTQFIQLNRFLNINKETIRRKSYEHIESGRASSESEGDRERETQRARWNEENDKENVQYFFWLYCPCICHCFESFDE